MGIIQNTNTITHFFLNKFSYANPIFTALTSTLGSSDTYLTNSTSHI